MFTRINHDLFAAWHHVIRESRPLIKAATSQHAYVPATRYYLDMDDPAETGVQAYAIRPDGELVYVWSTTPGQGDRIVADAVRNGATHLDCFDGYLVSLYSRHGFERVTSLDNWTPDGPAIVYMALPEHFTFALRRAEVDFAASIPASDEPVDLTIDQARRIYNRHHDAS